MKLTITVNLADGTEVNDIEADVVDPSDIWDAVIWILEKNGVEQKHVTSYVIVAVPN